jgi:hypothetical protein
MNCMAALVVGVIFTTYGGADFMLYTFIYCR